MALAIVYCLGNSHLKLSREAAWSNTPCKSGQAVILHFEMCGENCEGNCFVIEGTDISPAHFSVNRGESIRIADLSQLHHCFVFKFFSVLDSCPVQLSQIKWTEGRVCTFWCTNTPDNKENITITIRPGYKVHAWDPEGWCFKPRCR